MRQRERDRLDTTLYKKIGLCVQRERPGKERNRHHDSANRSNPYTGTVGSVFT